MKLKIVAVCLAALALSACSEGEVGIKAFWKVKSLEPAAAPTQTVRVVVEVVGASQPATPAQPAAPVPVQPAATVSSAPVRQRQQFVVKPTDDCADPCLKFQVKQSVQIHD